MNCYGSLKAVDRCLVVLACALGHAVGLEAYAEQADNGDCIPNAAVTQLGTTYAQRWSADALAFDPTSMRFACADNGDRIRLWNGRSGAQVKMLTPVRIDDLCDLALAPDGHTLAAVGWDGFLRIWDVQSGHCRFEARISEKNLSRVRFSPSDAHLFATLGAGGVIKVWTLTSEGGQLSIRAGPTLAGHSVAFSADGKWLAYGGVDKVIRVRNLNTGEEKRIGTPHGRSVTSVEFVKDGRYLVANGYMPPGHPPEGTDRANADEYIAVWDVEAGRLDRTFSMAYWEWNGCRLELSANGEIFVGITGPEVRIWRTDGWELLHAIERGLRGRVELSAAALSADGRRLAMCDRGRRIQLWDPIAGKEVLPEKGSHPTGVLHVAASAGGERVVTGDLEGTLIVWSRAEGAPLMTCKASDLNSVAISPDGRIVAAGVDSSFKAASVEKSQDGGYCVLWDPERGEVLHELNVPSVPTALTFSRDGRLLAIVVTRRSNPFTNPPEDQLPRSLIVWNVAKGETRYELPIELKDITAVRFADDEGKRLATLEKSARLWDMETGRQLGQVRLEEQPAAIGPNGEMVYLVDRTHTGASVTAHSIATGEPVHRSDLEMAKPFLLAVSTDGKVAVVGWVDPTSAGTLQLDVRSASTGKLMRCYEVPRGPTCLAFSPDGRWLLAGLLDQTALVWDTTVPGSE